MVKGNPRIVTEQKARRAICQMRNEDRRTGRQEEGFQGLKNNETDRLLEMIFLTLEKKTDDRHIGSLGPIKMNE